MSKVISISKRDFDNHPLPLIVAKKWEFALAYLVVETTYWYSVYEWVKGLLNGDSPSATSVWHSLKDGLLPDMDFTIQDLTYPAKDGKTYLMGCTTEDGLYRIAQYLASRKDHPLLEAINKFLAKNGAFESPRAKPDKPALFYDPRSTDKRPLPERIMSELGGTMDHINSSDRRLYSVKDWVYWVSGSVAKNKSGPWNDLKNALIKGGDFKVSEIIRDLKYETNSGMQSADFTDEYGLYLITQRMSDRSGMVRKVKKYLADAGVFVDNVRRKPKVAVDSGAISPDDAVDAAIEAYRKQGKSDEWIAVRIIGKVSRDAFTKALRAAVRRQMTAPYAEATNEIYRGLWRKTAIELKEAMNLSSKAKLRDHQPMLALHYEAIAEEIAAQDLREHAEITGEQACRVIRKCADVIGLQARTTSEYIGIDLATGNPLLKDGKPYRKR